MTCSIRNGILYEVPEYPAEFNVEVTNTRERKRKVEQMGLSEQKDKTPVVKQQKKALDDESVDLTEEQKETMLAVVKELQAAKVGAETVFELFYLQNK